MNKDWVPLTKAPVNKQASKELWSWPEYTPDKKIFNVDSDLPILFRKPTKMEIKNPQFVDLTGRQFARLTVLGVFQGPTASTGQRWVCRCICSRYTIRVAKAIKNPNNTKDACELCRHSEYLKRNEFFRQQGFDRD